MFLDLFKIIFSLVFINQSFAWFNNHEKIRLEDVKAITLHEGQWTTGRRNPAVPQLKCIGGSAASTAYIPKVVQCRNVGSDGFDAQWECKADMDEMYRFGKLQVSCEGYDYPNDPYILKGSCGLEYTLEYTQSGHRQSSNMHHHYERSNGRGSWWKFFLIVALIGFIVCKTNLKTIIKNQISRFSRNNSSDFRSRRPDPNTPPPSNQGYKTDEAPPSYDDATSNADVNENNSRNQPRRSGFWNGFTWGGIFGYLFGSRQNAWWPHWGHSPSYNMGYHTGCGLRRWRSNPSSGSNWFSGTSSSWNDNSSSGSSRTASGFGGTRRR